MAVERVGIWLYNNQHTQLVETDTYVLSQHCHTTGRQLQTADYPDHFTQPGSTQHYQILESVKTQTDGFAQRWLSPRQVGALIEVPVYRRGKVAGLVWYEHIDHARQWQSEEQTFAIAIANLITLTLENQVRQQQQALLLQQQQQAVLMSDALRTIGSAPSDNILLEQIARQISTLYQALGCEIWRYCPDDSAPIYPTVSYSRVSPSTPETPLSLAPQADPFLQLLLNTPQGLTSNNSSQPSPPNCLGEHWMVLPTLYGGQTNGFLSIRLPQSDFIPPDPEQTALPDFAIHTGIVLAHAQLIEQERQQKGTLSRQHKQLQREIIERQQAEQAWQESQRFIQSILDASTNILYVNNFDTGENFYVNRCLVSILGYAAEDLRQLGSHYLEQLIHADDRQQMRSQRSKLEHLADGEIVESEYRFQHRHGGWRWLLCRETVFHRDENGYPTQIFGTATDITERKQAEVALHEVNRELQRLASIDGLTEVANRRCFDKHLEQKWQSLQCSNTPITLILCDIDYFKSYNDEYGHQAGDVCLKKVAQAITRAVKRATDLVARYGGEEFAVVLPNTDMEGAQQVAVDIQQQISQLRIPHSRSIIDECITVSLGIATVTDIADSTPEGLIAAADRGLYRAKYEGRNRTCTEAF